MALTHIRLADITEDHLRRLIETQAAESLHVEYKRETYRGNDEGHREFLADVSSFANAAGGDLIIGMIAAKGVPTEIHPVAADGEAERLRLDQMARDGLEPRITNLETRTIPLAGGGCVIVIRVPKSYNPPLRVIFKKSGRFWARSSAGKFEPNVDELRRIFTDTPVFAERIRAFRIERIGQIAAGAAPVGLQGGANLVLHVVPFSAFSFGLATLPREIFARPERFPPIGGIARDFQIDVDGFFTGSHNDGLSKPQRAYVRVFRTGAVEAVASSLERGRDGKWLEFPSIEAQIIKFSRLYSASLHSGGVDPPYAVLASLMDVNGKTLLQGFVSDSAIPEDLPGAVCRKNQLHFVETIFEDVPADYGDAAKRLRATLDHLANASGQSYSPSFDAQGDYVGKFV